MRAEGIAPAECLANSVMTNFDHSINEEVAAQLLTRPDACAQYAGWNFCGYVWHEGDEWACEVWVYHVPREVIRAGTLREIMDEVSGKYGYD